MASNSYKMMSAIVAIVGLLLFSLFISSCEGINPSSKITVIDGSVVGPQCPGIAKLKCTSVDLTSQSWTYNDLSPIDTFLFDSQPTSTIPRDSNPAFPIVELLVVAQNSDDPDFANFTSILTVDLTQLVQQNVTSITCGDPDNSDVLGVNVSILQPSVPPSPELIEVTASYQSEILNSITAVWMKFEDMCQYNLTLNYKLLLNNSVETEISQASCEDQVCTGTLLNISGEGGYILSLTTESSAGSSNATIYPNPIYQRSQQYFIPNVESSNCQVTANCISFMNFNSNSTCTAQYSNGNTITAPVDTVFKLPIPTFDINYVFQFSVLFDDILKIEVLLEEEISSNIMLWMITETITMAIGLISCATSLILIVISMILLYTTANSMKKLRIFLTIVNIIMVCCTTALIIVIGIIAGIQPSTCNGQQLMTDIGLIVCLVISLLITTIVITVFCIILKCFIKLRSKYTISEKGFNLSNTKDTVSQSDKDSNQCVSDSQGSVMEDKSIIAKVTIPKDNDNPIKDIHTEQTSSTDNDNPIKDKHTEQTNYTDNDSPNKNMYTPQTSSTARMFESLSGFY